MDFAAQCAVFGLPPVLTPTQELYLLLNAEVARAVQTHTAVEAALIASGGVGPWEYYLMLAGGDERAAARMQSRAHLQAMMGANG